MKETLRQNIERMRTDMINRIEQLNKSVAGYKQAENFENAMMCDIKRQQLIMVLGRLDEALKQLLTTLKDLTFAYQVLPNKGITFDAN